MRQAVNAAADGDLQIVQHTQLRFEYPVVFTRDMFVADNRVLAAIIGSQAASKSRALVVIDEGVDAAWQGLRAQITAYFARHADVVRLADELLVVVGGERAKNDHAVVDRVLERLFALGFDRHSYLIAIGGGAVLDAVGYAASLFHRGLRLIRVPTTVLAQDDAGVGVKNGINAFGAKNALGTFAPPFAVVNDAAFLDSLSQREHIAGIAEAIKVALIRDRAFFGWIEANAPALRARERRATEQLIRRCAELHLQHIRESGDPFETGSARPLDFGHWAAHKLEVLTEHDLRHGEAVAIGMAIDTRYAALIGMLSPEAAARVLAVIEAVGLPRSHPALGQVDAQGAPCVLRGLEEFREHLGGRLTITLLAELGRGIEVHEIDHVRMREAIASVGARG